MPSHILTNITWKKAQGADQLARQARGLLPHLEQDGAFMHKASLRADIAKLNIGLLTFSSKCSLLLRLSPSSLRGLQRWVLLSSLRAANPKAQGPARSHREPGVQGGLSSAPHRPLPPAHPSSLRRRPAGEAGVTSPGSSAHSCPPRTPVYSQGWGPTIPEWSNPSSGGSVVMASATQVGDQQGPPQLCPFPPGHNLQD